MSGAEVIGVLSGIIGIIDASIKIYDSARKDLKLSETFDTVGRRLPIILDTLQTCENHLQPVPDSLSPDVCEALERLLEDCDEKASRLRQIFEKVIPGEHDTWKKRYLKIARRLGKGSTVEELMVSVTEDVQLIVNHRAVQSAKPEENAELEKIIKEMKSIKPSLPEEESCAISFNSAGGAQTNNVNSGSGQQINNNGPVATQNFNSVIKQKEDFSFRNPVGAHFGHAPHIDPTLFIGRRSEIEEMKRVLEPGNRSQQQRRLVLGGMGGVGKTQLAIAYASHCQHDYDSVFWLNAKSEATLKDSFRKVAAEIVFDIQDPGVVNSEEVLIHIRRWLSHQKNSQWLLIFDNYDEPEQYKIENYYPPASHGAIVVTTRLPRLVAGRPILIKSLKETEESLEVLRTRSERENVTSDPFARSLAERLAGLPLALATAGAYLRHSSLTFERYLQEYEKRWEINKRQPLQLPEYEGRTLYTTWAMSHAHLQSHDVDAAKLLELLAYFDNQSIWYELLHSGLTDDSLKWLHEVVADDIKFDGAMTTLTEYCFLEVQTALNSWSMHACVHDWTRASLKTVTDAQKYWYAFDCIAASIDRDKYFLFEHLSYGRLAAHAVRLVQDVFCPDDFSYHRLEKAFVIAMLLEQQRQLAAMEQMSLLALARCEKMLGAEHWLTLEYINILGIVHCGHGKLAEAEQMYLRALCGKEKVLGVDHQSTLNTVNNLGVVYLDQGKLAEAEQMLLRTLVGNEKAWGPEHPSTLDTVNNLGLVYRELNKLAEAEQMYLRTLHCKEKALGAEHTSTLDTVQNLGIVYRAQGRLVEAEQMYSRALAGYQKAWGAKNTHYATLRTINNLGNLYHVKSRLGEAEQMLLRALDGYKKMFGAENMHITTLGILINLGAVYSNQGRLDEAEQVYLRALAGYEQAFGADNTHIATLYTVSNLGCLYSKQGRLGEAEQMYSRALTRGSESLGWEHPFTKIVMGNMQRLAPEKQKRVDRKARAGSRC